MRAFLAFIFIVVNILSFPNIALGNWIKVGDLGGVLSASKLSRLTNCNGQPFNDIAVDSTGRIFATAGDPGGWYWDASNTDFGHISIFTPDVNQPNGYMRYDINLQNCSVYNNDSITPNQNVAGSVTRLVISEQEDDVYVYAVQNWHDLRYSYWGPKHETRVLQIRKNPNNPNEWVVKIIAEYPISDTNMIESIALHPAGGVVWTVNGSDSYWKNNWLWKYQPNHNGNVTQISSGNQGWLIAHKMYHLEYVENGWWAVFYTGDESNNNYVLSAIGENLQRRIAINGENPDTSAYFGLSKPTAPLAYDNVNKRLWYGGAGVSQGDPSQWHNMMIRWDGDPANGGLFTTINDDKKTGVTQQKINHAIPKKIEENYGGRLWISALAANPNDGSGWFAIMGDSNFNYYLQDRVYVKYDINFIYDLALQDVGVPQSGAKIQALTIKGTTAYALVIDPITGIYSVYKRNANNHNYGYVDSISKAKEGQKYYTYFMANPKVLTNRGGGSGFSYVQDQNRASGIRIEYNSFASPAKSIGDLMTFHGTLNIVDGELVLENIGQMNVSGNAPAKPLGMNIKAVGGNALGLQPATNPAYGLNNVGLFVTVIGKVTYRSADGNWFTIEDGSNVTTWHPNSGAVNGLRIAYPYGSLAVGDMVSVRGVVGVEQFDTNGDDIIDLIGQRVIRVESASDIKKF
ncbi:MAG: hypothetical protein SNJ70_10070 [Armatimonadota bacterium]